MWARFRYHGDAGRDRVQIDVGAGRQQRFFVEDRHAFEAFLEERSARVVLAIGQPRQWFLQAFHEPAQALQARACRRHPLDVLEAPFDPGFGDW